MPTTPNKGYEIQTTGTNSGTWGDVLNDDVISIIDSNLGSITTKSLTNVNVSLSTTESQSLILRLTGTLTGAVQITTSCLGMTIVENLTTGAFAVTFTNGVGTPVTVNQSAVSVVMTDGTNGPRLVSIYPTDYYPGGTDVAVADGGTGRGTATAYAVLCGGTTSTGAQQSIASVGTSGQILTSNGAGALPTFQSSGVLPAATQAEMEAAASTTVTVTPGRQQFHPGSAKFWAHVTFSGGTPTLAASYNMSSITDSGAGRTTLTIATDFSSGAWAASGLCSDRSDGTPLAFSYASLAAGTIVAVSFLASSNNVQDPNSFGFVGFGDQ